MFRNRYQELSNPERRAFWITLVMAFFFAVFAATLLDTLLNAPNIQYRFVNAVPFALSFIALISALLFMTSRVSAGAWLIQLAALVLLGVNATQAEGFGFSSAFILLAITLYISVQSLRGREAFTALWAGIAGAIAIILLDAFWTEARVPALAQDVRIAGIISVIIGLILVTTTIVQFNNYVFRTKLIVSLALVALIPSVIFGYYNNFVARSILMNEAQASLSNLSNQAASRIDTYLNIQLEEIRVQAQQPAIVKYLKLESFKQVGSPEEAAALDILQTLALKDRSVFVRSIAVLNASGKNILDTANRNIGRDESSFEFFKQPMQTDNPYLSNITFLKSGEGSIYFSAPVENEFGKIIGIVRAEYSSGIVQNQLGTQPAGLLLAVVDNETYLRIAYTDRTDRLNKTFKVFTDQELTSLQQSGRMPQGTQANLYVPASAFVAGLQNLSTETYFTAQSPFLNEQAVTTGKLLATEPWLVVASESQSTLLGPIRRQSQAGILISLGILMSVAAAAFFAAQALTRPITSLTAVAEKISQGDLTARSTANTQDEIGTLASTFNRMTSQLRDSLQELERRVIERTADVEMARLVSERRAQELHAISEVSRVISTEQRLEILLPLVTRLVSERFDFYHAGIFFVDETRRFAYLQAANSEGGQKMLTRGHRLEIGIGLVGTVAQTGRPRIALDVGSDAAFFDNPDLPDTRSEMALPLNFRGRTIGVLDVQSTKPGAFTAEDANTLSILADQVAIAIENARLFGQTQQARDEAEALYTQVIRQEWSAFASQESKIGYRQTVTGGKPIAKPVESEDIRQALKKGQVVVLDGKELKTQPSIAIPVKLRGQTIGVLNIKAPTKDRKWNQDEINLAQAVSDRLALALDNVRLLQESQRRAAKEAKIGEVTAKIGASINMNSVLQTAVEELGRALPGAEVVIQFEKPEEQR